MVKKRPEIDEEEEKLVEAIVEVTCIIRCQSVQGVQDEGTLITLPYSIARTLEDEGFITINE